jgi:hypothetical protein
MCFPIRLLCVIALLAVATPAWSQQGGQLPFTASPQSIPKIARPRPTLPDYPEVPFDRRAKFSGLGKIVHHLSSSGGSPLPGILYVYYGNNVNGNPSGPGIDVYPDGFCYQGDHSLDGKAVVTGTMWYRDGSIYTGEFHMSSPFGRGTFSSADGSYGFMGNFDSGGGGFGPVPSGICDLWYKLKIRYHGNWVGGATSGKGEYDFEDGTIYEGESQTFVLSGDGTVRYPSGSRFVGRFTNNVGIGTIYSFDGNEHLDIRIDLSAAMRQIIPPAFRAYPR